MTNKPAQTLAETRAYSTDDERKVLALEAIGDHLRLLVDVLRPVAQPAPTGSASATDRDLRAASAWENEGGSLALDTANSLGIKHSVVDQFEVGGYRYSKLDDAIAEANRARRQQSAGNT